MFQVMKIAFAALLAAMAGSAFAQVDGSGWTAKDWGYSSLTSGGDNNVISKGSGKYRCFQDGRYDDTANGWRARCEMRIRPDYGDNVIVQYQATYTVKSGTTSRWTILQVFGDRDRPAGAFPHALEIVFERDPGKPNSGYVSRYWNDRFGSVGNGPFTINVVHAPGKRNSNGTRSKGKVKLYLNGSLKRTFDDNAASVYHFRSGVYEQFAREAIGVSSTGDVTVSNIKYWTKPKPRN